MGGPAGARALGAVGEGTEPAVSEESFTTMAGALW